MAAAHEASSPTLPGKQGPAAQTRGRPGHLAPLALAILVAANAGLAAITLTTDEPLYELLVHALATLGVALSLVGALTRRSFSLVGSLIMLAAFAAYAVRFQLGLLLVNIAYPVEVV